MILRDTVKLATTDSDMYGDDHVTLLDTVRALFVQRTGMTHDANMNSYVANSVVYLDPLNETVRNNAYRLEGMYIIAQPFGDDEQWFKITGVNVGQRKLTTNSIDNIHCDLQKVAGIPYGIS